MDRFSFLNAAHSQLIEDLYQQYLKFPDFLEPSWKAFFKALILHWRTTVMMKERTNCTNSVNAAPAVQQISQAAANGEVPEHIIKRIQG